MTKTKKNKARAASASKGTEIQKQTNFKQSPSVDSLKKPDINLPLAFATKTVISTPINLPTIETTTKQEDIPRQIADLDESCWNEYSFLFSKSLQTESSEQKVAKQILGSSFPSARNDSAYFEISKDEENKLSEDEVSEIVYPDPEEVGVDHIFSTPSPSISSSTKLMLTIPKTLWRVTPDGLKRTLLQYTPSTVSQFVEGHINFIDSKLFPEIAKKNVGSTSVDNQEKNDIPPIFRLLAACFMVPLMILLFPIVHLGSLGIQFTPEFIQKRVKQLLQSF